MYYFTGSNIFGQWYGCTNNIIEEFRTFSVKQNSECNFDVINAKLVHVGWSHNIFLFNNKFFIVGDYKSSGQCLEVISLPNDYNDSSVTIVSDNYNLVLVRRNTCNIQLIKLSDKVTKNIKLTTESPVHWGKRLKHEVNISKCLVLNDSLMFLTSNGLVYNGLLPSLVDTTHCLGKPVDIQCGYEHFILLTDAGRLYTWGNGRRLQLGHGDVNSIDAPVEVEALAGIKIVKIAAGGWHSLALSEFGDLYAWGWNDTGQLGIKEENSDKKLLKSYSLPTLVDLYRENESEENVNIVDIACGSRHSAILLEDHTVWTTGNNKYGQLGISIESNPTVHQFKKVWSNKCTSKLFCGQWSTVVNDNT